MSSKMSMSFFLQSKRRFLVKTFHDFSPYSLMDFNGYQTVQGTKDSFSAASKGFKRFQTTNKGLINRNDRSLKKKKKFKFY